MTWDDWPAYGWCAGMPDSRDILRYRELAYIHSLYFGLPWGNPFQPA